MNWFQLNVKRQSSVPLRFDETEASSEASAAIGDSNKLFVNTNVLQLADEVERERKANKLNIT
jgi:hypothetical protein